MPYHRTKSRSASSQPKAKIPSCLVIKRSGIHRTGVFAKTDILDGARVIEYVGEKITKTESERRAERSAQRAKKRGTKARIYLFDLNKRYDIDGDVPYNPARYINHSCDPNCETDIIRGHIWIVALRDIRKGEEISYNYGWGVEDYKDYPCRCGSPKCVGYMVAEEDWSKLRRRLKNKKQSSSSRSK